MSWFGRLFGAKAVTPPPPPPPANSVLIAEDLLPKLGLNELPLQSAVDTALRAHFANQAQIAQMRGEKIPFWLRRDDETSGEIEEKLRDRVMERHAAEDERVPS